MNYDNRIYSNDPQNAEIIEEPVFIIERTANPFGDFIKVSKKGEMFGAEYFSYSDDEDSYLDSYDDALAKARLYARKCKELARSPACEFICEM